MHNVLKCLSPELEGKWREAVWEGAICGGNEREYHPTQKPRWILEKLLWVSSQPGSAILDSFAGSGSTAFAARVLPGRKVTLIEPDKKYKGLIEGISEDLHCPIVLMNTIGN